ncbi:hypothetical protein [Cryptosporangium phraense]|uniref:Uncharacterized protein n=1 Tax=Cryptosporangium phraense TaxID=2593070 RepID=A0A545AUX8_9ACTN|nr:hypothetical protein [Cryptosporangium phraense]TQS45136.1 hypothetical protein FL583_11620 [Cryptosporangium phraense]
MTRYALNTDRGELIATWDTGHGPVFTPVTTSQALTRIQDTDPTLIGLHVTDLASALTLLSTRLWRLYTQPASAAPTTEVNTEGWRREQSRKAFATVVPTLTSPHLPDDPYSGSPVITTSLDPVEEAAHRAGRALYYLGDQTVTDAVAADVRAELDAVERAERGDLTGRAAQAVKLSRAGFSPVQVAAAHDILTADPLRPAGLHHLDPASAAVAAAHWLWAAARVTADTTESDSTDILVDANQIEALPYESPTQVLIDMEDGESPAAMVVTELISDAMDIAEGHTRIADELIDRLGDEPEDPEDLIDGFRRLTPLDPRRPAPDLLEDLLAGIHGCWLVYEDNADFRDPDIAEDEPDEKLAMVRDTRRKTFVLALTDFAVTERHRIGL